MKTCMIYATAKDEKEAQSLAKSLVNERLAACVNIIPKATSVYRWNDQIEVEAESILLIKTTIERRNAAMSRLKHMHSYDTPCVVSYDMSAGLPDYLNWIAEQTS